MTATHGPEPDEVDDDPEIPDNEIVYRRLSHSGRDFVAVDQLTGERRPSSGAFNPDPDGVSVYRHMVLAQHNLGPSAVRRAATNLVASVGVGDLRSITLGVRDDPWPPDADEPVHPRNAAHALIKGLEVLGKGERRRRQKQLVALPSVAVLDV